ncbi:hypothetical protein DesfrDRAFT_2515 [Solidesulfovibrio fructosivorans JJ]]|uniref:PABS domain-containing protein n=2 Tax=Solidesulfovibrio fructosivorans TaxID=878 RepID=E1JY16_SOLFR|nr:hypothetical protein DesfrDRAFT_2515 [Solidesulfovibrio fructosivorans JJ]]
MTDNVYDVITIDPAPPLWSAGTVNLYTKEFLTLCKEHISEGGVVSLWLPPAPVTDLAMIMKTFTEVFPDATLWRGPNFPGFYCIGGKKSFDQSRESLERVVASLLKAPDLGEWFPRLRDPSVLRRMYVFDSRRFAQLVKPFPDVTDDRPYTEFPLWRGVLADRVPILSAENLARMVGQPEAPSAKP